jgi:hypothetical protein
VLVQLGVLLIVAFFRMLKCQSQKQLEAGTLFVSLFEAAVVKGRQNTMV